MGINLPGGIPEKRDLIAGLRADGYSVVDLSDNEMAKVHIRYMVGGRSTELTDERIYRFQFPERPGALLRFLDGLADGFNITLFHYRNHGADYGRVLAGISVPREERQRFDTALDDLGYPYVDENGQSRLPPVPGNGRDCPVGARSFRSYFWLIKALQVSVEARPRGHASMRERRRGLG